MVSGKRRHGDDRRPPPGRAAGRRPTIAGWLWWTSTPSARPRMKEQFQKLPADVQGEFFARMERYRDGESRPREVKDIGDGILELRLQIRRDQYRLLLTRWGPYAVVLDCFLKDQRKTDKTRALERAAAWKRTRGTSPPELDQGTNL